MRLTMKENERRGGNTDSLICQSIKQIFLNFSFSLIVAFLPRIKHLLISWLWSPSTVILESKKIKSVTVSIVSPLFAMKGSDAMILVF